ncbi:MAG: VWA domain-containing protein, partial [Candidatus Binataceae bacterium]
MAALADIIREFIAELRTAGVRISVAESLDAMRAVSAAGLERTRMREALAATLIKDEADRAVFERVFAHWFGR